MDAVGVIASNNDNPIGGKDSINPIQLYQIVSKTDTEMVVAQVETAPHSVPTYMGGFLSQDRAVVYWENDTKPLP